jgi:molybdate transport system regulatory protein
MAIEALLSLKGEEGTAVGRDRFRLLEAVAREGSISAGAKAVGLTYKAAWDALDAMANLFGQSLLMTRIGGRAGGGAQLTPTDLRVIEAFRRLEAELARVVRAIEPELAGTGISPLNLVSGILMKTSARNALRGTITAISSDALASDVAVAVSHSTTIHALVTNASVRELGLCAELSSSRRRSSSLRGRGPTARLGQQLHRRHSAAMRDLGRGRGDRAQLDAVRGAANQQRL